MEITRERRVARTAASLHALSQSGQTPVEPMRDQSQKTPPALRAIFAVFWLVLFISVASAQVADALPVFSAQERELKEKETHSYRLALTSGQFFHALVEQKEIDLNLAVFGPDGLQISETDSPNDLWGTEVVLLLAD